MLLTLALFFVCYVVAQQQQQQHARTLRCGVHEEFKTLGDAIDSARAGDTIQLVDPSYDLTKPLVIERSLTIDVAPDTVRAVLRSSVDDVDVLLAINANDVVLRNLIFGASADARAIDIFISSGTQNQQSSLFGKTSVYGGRHQTNDRRRSLSTTLLLDGVTNGGNVIDQSTRGIRNIQLQNIDFSLSSSAINVAFDVGAYINVQITRCVFGARGQAIVTVEGSRFASSTPIELNAFVNPQSIAGLKGSGLVLGTNYWSSARPAAATTYCADRQCTTLGPVVDGDQPQKRAFVTIAAALQAGVRNVLVTAEQVEFGAMNDAITSTGTTIRGRVLEACINGASVPLVTMRDSIVSSGASLVAISDLRFDVAESVRNALSYVDAPAASLDGSDVLLERVVFTAHAEQTVLTMRSKSITLTLSRCAFVGGAKAVDNGGGALTVTDSTFVGNTQASILISGTGSGTGLRVSGTQFTASPRGSIVFEPKVLSSQMLPISITCSRFVFAQFIEPTDCLRNAQQCANALRYNSFIEVIAPASLTTPVANRRFLAHGSNHVEHVAASAMAQFTQMAQRSESGAFSFSFADQQGRFGRVRADVALQQRAAHQFVVASNVPMRQECFAESVPGQRVVSGLFSVTSDAPERCTSVALQFTVVSDERDNTTAASNDGVSVYDVRHLGNSARGSVVWQRAASSSFSLTKKGTESSFQVEASSGAGALLQAVVVAQTLTTRETASVLASGDAARVQRAHQHFCVSCAGDEIPVYVMNERCDGGRANVFTDFDVAFAAASKAATSDSVSLMVYGNKCASKQCNLSVARAAFTLEGFSVTQQARITRPITCAADVPMLAIEAPSVTVRFVLLTTESTLSTAQPINAVVIRAEKVRVSFCTLSGGVSIEGSNAEIIGNEIAVGAEDAIALHVGARTLTTLVQSNTFKNGLVDIERGARFVTVDRNTFAQTAALSSDGELTSTGNTFIDRSPVDGSSASSAFCLRSTASAAALTSTGDGFGTNCELHLLGDAKIRVTGKKSAAPWFDVRVRLTSTTDVRIANVDLLGPNTQIVLENAATVGVVLYDVGIDLEQSSVSDALLGRPLTRTPCSGTHEPQIGGFALADSLLLDAKTRKMLFGGSVPRLKTAEYIDPLDGSVNRCVDRPTADYCRCIVDVTTPLSTRAQPQSTEPIAIVGDEQNVAAQVPPVDSVEPLDDDSLLDQILPQTLARAIKKAAAVGDAQQRFRPQQLTLDDDDSFIASTQSGGDDEESGSSHTGWIVAGIIVGIIILVLIIVVCCCCLPSATSVTTRRVTINEDDTEETETVTTTGSYARHKSAPTRPIGSSLRVTAADLEAISKANEVKPTTIVHRKVTSRMQEDV